MLRYICKRLLIGVLVVFCVSVLIFGIMQAMPGDPIELMADTRTSPERVAEMKVRWGLDQPVPVQYFFWLRNILRGDFGISITTKQSVSYLIRERLPYTLMLTGSATLRTPEGLTEVHPGDMLFFEAGETGAHQLYNHTDEPCTYLDLRSYIGHDVCEYPDSRKLILMPTAETFRKGEQHAYFEGEEGVDTIWNKLSRR